MSFQNYLNVERLAMNIIESSIKELTDTNLDSYGDVDYQFMTHNLHHGVIAVVFCVNLYETSINTILGNELGYLDEEILKCSFEVKLSLICKNYGIDIAELKSKNEYGLLREVTRLRNDMIHFKNGDVGMSSLFHSKAKIKFGKTKNSIASIFVKSQIQKYYCGVMDFLKILCSKCGLFIHEDCEILDSDGANAIYTFITKIDPKSITYN